MRAGIVYSYVNSLGDVAFCVKSRGKIREVVATASDGMFHAWLPVELGAWAALHIGETAHEANAIAWMTGA